jgi:hypothetical protein
MARNNFLQAAQTAVDELMAASPPGGGDDTAQADLGRIDLYAQAAVGAVLAKRMDQVSELLTDMLTGYGRESAGRAVAVLCAVPAMAVRISCDMTARVGMNFPFAQLDEESVDEFRRAAAIAGELLAGTISRNTLRTTTALVDMYQGEAMPVLRVLARYVAAFVESVQEVSGDAFFAYDQLLPAPADDQPSGPDDRV